MGQKSRGLNLEKLFLGARDAAASSRLRISVQTNQESLIIIIIINVGRRRDVVRLLEYQKRRQNLYSNFYKT